MTLNIKVFSKSLTIDTHYARDPAAFPVNITGSALNFFIKDQGGPNKTSTPMAQTSFYSVPDSSYKSGAINNNSLTLITKNEVNNFYAKTNVNYNVSNYFISNQRDNTSLVLTPNSNSSTIIYSRNAVSNSYATVAVNYNTDNYFVSGNYETADDNLPTGTRVIVSTLKNLSSDSGDTTAPTLDETEIYEFPTLTSFQTTNYSDNITKKTIVTSKEISGTSFANANKQIYILPENGTNSHSKNITLKQIISNTPPTITSYTSGNKKIQIDNIQNVDLSNVIQKRIGISTAMDKGAVSKSKADTAVVTMFIKNEADIAYFDLDGYISFKQVTPFNDPIPPSDSTTGGGDTGGGTGGGTGTTTGPIQSWSS